MKRPKAYCPKISGYITFVVKRALTAYLIEIV
jgi:hypothetical protein